MWKCRQVSDLASHGITHTHTCADKHDIILPVLCLDAVHNNLFQLVRNVGFHKHRLAQGWIHRPPHQRVVASKLQHRIREVLCASKLSAWLVGDFTRALKRKGGMRKMWRNKGKGRCVIKNYFGWLRMDKQKQDRRTSWNIFYFDTHHFPPLCGGTICFCKRLVALL